MCFGTQYYTFLISHSQPKRNGIETQIVAINVIRFPLMIFNVTFFGTCYSVC